MAMYGPTSCGVCGGFVDLEQGYHVHDPKPCRTCGISRPASAFAVHKSSGDGRRHTCNECLDRRRREKSESKRMAQPPKSRDERSRLMERHGYEWRVQAPDGRMLTVAEAFTEMRKLDARGSMWDIDLDY